MSLSIMYSSQKDIKFVLSASYKSNSHSSLHFKSLLHLIQNAIRNSPKSITPFLSLMKKFQFKKEKTFIKKKVKFTIVKGFKHESAEGVLSVVVARHQLAIKVNKLRFIKSQIGASAPELVVPFQNAFFLKVCVRHYEVHVGGAQLLFERGFLYTRNAARYIPADCVSHQILHNIIHD